MINGKKHYIISLFLAVVVVAGCISAYAASDIADVLKGLGITPSGYVADDAAATRLEFAYMVAELINPNEMKNRATRFSDVPDNTDGSGQVEFLASVGIINGYGDGTFGADDSVTVESAYAMLMRGLGYESLKENMTYSQLAAMLGFKLVASDADGYVSGQAAAEIIYDALTSDLPVASYKTDDNGSMSPYFERMSGNSVLHQKLGISMYRGVIEDVDTGRSSIMFRVEDNASSYNPAELVVNTEKEFIVDAKQNLYDFKKLPVTIWVNEDEKVVYIEKYGDTEVKYLTISSVNGDSDTASSYSTSGITRMTFLDDKKEYKVSRDATFEMDGSPVKGTIVLTGKYARVVMEGENILHTESWNLTEGGIITSIDKNSISYIKGSGKKHLTKLDEYDSINYFVDNRHASARDLKADSLFYYAKTADNSLTIVSCKNIISDMFDGLGSGYIELGNLNLTLGAGAYYQTESGIYRKISDNKSEFIGLYNKVYASAYMSPMGEVLYIRAALEGEVVDSGSFYGAVSGVSTNNLSPDEADVELVVFRSSGVEKKIYKTKNNTKWGTYEDEYGNEQPITINVLKENAGKTDGSGIYKFKTSADNKILSVDTPKPFFGFDANGKYTPDQLYKRDGYMIDGPYIERLNGAGVEKDSNVQSRHGGNVYFNPETFYLLYEINGEFTGKKINLNVDTQFRKFWGNAAGTLYASDTEDDVYIRFFAEDAVEVPDVTFICAGEKGLNRTTVEPGDAEANAKYGIVQGVTSVLDKFENPAYGVKVLEGGEEKMYTLSEESVKELNTATGKAFGEGYLFKYFVTAGIASDEIYIDPASVFNIADAASGISVTGFYYDTIDKVEGTRIYFKANPLTGGDVYEQNFARYIQNEGFVCVAVDEDSEKEKYSIFDYNMLEDGDRVLWKNGNWGINMILVFK